MLASVWMLEGRMAHPRQNSKRHERHGTRGCSVDAPDRKGGPQRPGQGRTRRARWEHAIRCIFLDGTSPRTLVPLATLTRRDPHEPSFTRRSGSPAAGACFTGRRAGAKPRLRVPVRAPRLFWPELQLFLARVARAASPPTPPPVFFSRLRTTQAPHPSFSLSQRFATSSYSLQLYRIDPLIVPSCPSWGSIRGSQSMVEAT